jgi:hypothetical protein
MAFERICYMFSVEIKYMLIASLEGKWDLIWQIKVVLHCLWHAISTLPCTDLFGH